MSNTTSKKSEARQRIVETAERLFYAHGIRAVGIDRIIAEAEVAKMSLYNHFKSKDDLILAVLQYREQQVDDMFSKTIDRHVRKGMDRLEAFFAALKHWFKTDGFRGCSFINASVELADGSHPAAKFSAAHKSRFGELLENCVADRVGGSAHEIAPAITLLVEGAIVSAVMQQTWKPADVARDAALSLADSVQR